MSDETLALTTENVEKVLDELRPFLMADGGNVEIAEIDGELWLIDFKTSQQLDPEMALQLSAYKMLWDCANDRKIDRLGVVWCKKNFRGKEPVASTKYLHEFTYAPEDWYCAYKLFKRYSEDAKGNIGPKVKIEYQTEFSLGE